MSCISTARFKCNFQPPTAFNHSVLLRTFGFRTRDSDCNCSSFTVSDILKNKPIYLPAILHFFPLQKRSTFAAGPNLHRNLTEPWKTDEYGYKVCVAHSITNQGNSFGKWYWIIVRLLWHINVWSILLLLLKCFRERAALPCGLHCGVHAAWGSLPRYFHAFIILQWAIDFFVVFCLLSTEKNL